ncbi:glutathione S-transferase [bacterium (Candidatus Blackallbacteria) CG17_big_fil_post_rev_8_21_14_2_50_48_46]|uniref:Glutathione S-transferase n=1 Tax=bacterium (Candidatus Blackallbacteria) CG17_big_fil_post_rev_8_21_14_2_50_48_46 TaxID=2014261 RepID=A0A2M7G1W7_9BACT|nr:MAG: glutathione S-transferase [bacterium (Candidatus Blackallbacteria) CG17_big_fil_post_rev_8_21_14_2_50_48_46]
MSQLTLYTAAGNAAERVLWALNYKEISYQMIEIESLPVGAYARINPYGYVPTLKIGEELIAESLAIIEFLEETCPEPTLFPGTALERARIREICEFINSTVHPVQNRSVLNFLRPELDSAAMKSLRAEWLHRCLQKLAPRLWQHGNFAVGTAFSLADILVAVIYKRALSQGVQAQEFQEFEAWMQYLFQQEVYRRSAPFSWPVKGQAI